MTIESRVRITSVRYDNYKALANFTVRLSDRNFLVGPNNAGKSTIISAFRILSVALRRMNRRKLDMVAGPTGRAYGLVIPADALPISLENVHTNYTEEDTLISFRLSNGNELQLYFPKDGACSLIADAKGTPLLTAAAFRNAFPITLAVIPVLAPVDHSERLVQDETVQSNISTHRASGNFRSYWYLSDENTFAAFASLVLQTWPGMQVTKPILVNHQTNELMMFCEENRIPRELYWVGSGFQIWCQLLTHLFRAQSNTLVVIDEPEIYLHADLQRQLVGLLRTFEADIVVATHSTEIMGEADPHEMVFIDKKNKFAERIKNVEKLQVALAAVGSIHNIALSRLSRSRRVVFFEGDSDFKLVRVFAKQLGFEGVASGLDLFPAKSDGFGSWQKVASLGWGIAKALDSAIGIAAVYDRDYFADGYISEVEQKLSETLAFAHVFDRKEIENFLLMPNALQRAVNAALLDKANRTETPVDESPDVVELLREITDEHRLSVMSQRITREVEHRQEIKSKEHSSSLHNTAMKNFEVEWATLPSRLKLVPGKIVLAELRDRLTNEFHITVTDTKIVTQAKSEDIAEDMRKLLTKLDAFRKDQLAKVD